MPRSFKKLQDEHKSPRSTFSSKERKGSDGSDEQKRPLPFGPWLVIGVILLLLFLWALKQSPQNSGNRVPYSFFFQQLQAGNVSELKFFDNVVVGKWKTPPTLDGQKLGSTFNVVLPPPAIEDPELRNLLRQQDVKVDAEKTEPGVGTQLLLWMIGPVLLIVFLWYLMRRSADPMGTGMLGNFARSPARRFRPYEQKTTFQDVAGMEHAKRELQEVVEFLKDPSKFQALGAKIPKGVLLVGPPGTGKTLLARATAGEAGVPFFSVSGSEFIQMFVGVGASRVRDLFRTARDNAPCIVFIDEIDAVGRMRGAGLGGGHDEREQTLNQILSEMDGFEEYEAVIVLAATNRPDVLDPALLRPGRFDRQITIERPTREGRLGILKVHCRDVPLAPDVDLEKIAAATIGFSGADLRNLVNEAALNAARHEKKLVDRSDFEHAYDRVLMGPEREDILNQHEREMTAYHEAGHALIAWLLPDLDPIHKVTIIPRGRALGVTRLVPEEERYHIGERRLHAELTMILAGRAAEKAVFDEYSAGAEDDLKRATQIARRMVGHWGMSDAIGPVAFRHSEEHPFLGKEIHESRDFSDQTAYLIDQEVQRILTNASDRAYRILTQHRDHLDRVAHALLEKETLEREDLDELLSDVVELPSEAETA